MPLEDPAYFVSHGGEAFPNLILVLQGYGVTVDLVGTTFIKNGITSSTFKQVPDVPVGSFELNQTLTLNVIVPQGGRLSASGKGLTSAAKSASGRQTLTLMLKERHAGKLGTSVLLRFTPSKGKQRKILRKTLHVTFG